MNVQTTVKERKNQSDLSSIKFRIDFVYLYRNN